MGWLFLWPVLDKLFGLGFATESGEGWIDGASSTYGFLTFATKGPFAEFYQGMAGSAAVEWLFLLGLLGAGLTLLLGIGGRLGAASGLMLLLMMYTASAIWPEHNPFLDDHIVYAGVLTGLALTDSGRYLGLGGRWQRTRLVQRMGILR
jgi:thiosulfate dehydrogenase [quinone] large subunit